ncbi:MAG TPA: hypothetical protein VMZ31_02675 [Phycisphaerae bacterium]|nr:hypothetical protein [Phycisphaerae bacterium]
MNAACRPMLDKMADLVSGLLSTDDRDAVRGHTNQCASCRNYLNALEREDQRLGEFLGQVDAEMSRAADDAVVAVRSAWASGAIKPIPWWRMVMESRTVKLATSGAIAATLIVAAVVATHSAPPAYAIEQTIEAMRKVQFVYVHGRDWKGRNLEAWMKVDPNTGMIDSYRLDEKDARRLTVTTPSHTYYYDREADLVRSVGGTVAMTWVRWGRFFEDAVEWSQRLGGEIRTTPLCDPRTGRDAIAIDLESEGVIVKAMIDSRTKLPTEVHIETLFGPIEGVPFQHIDQLEFPKQMPDELFRFDVPESATVVRDSHPFADRLLPVEVLDFAVDVHEQARERVGATAEVPVNTQLYIIDEQRRLARGGIQVVRNRTDKPRGGEISLGSFSPGNIRLFDRDGTQLPSHVVQYRLFQGGKYRLYYTLEEPMPPGETRYLFYAISGQHSLTRSASDAAYGVHMDNHFGNEVVENFILVTPSDQSIQSTSEPYAFSDTLGSRKVFVWQKLNPPNQTNRVDAVLMPE